MDRTPEYADIMNMFRFLNKSEWAPDSIFKGKSRQWVRALNDLIESGYIEKKKSHNGYKYRWKGVWPENF